MKPIEDHFGTLIEVQSVYKSYGLRIDVEWQETMDVETIEGLRSGYFALLPEQAQELVDRITKELES